MLFSHLPLTAQTHFLPVTPTGKPYVIAITGATLNGQPVVSGTEIGVFDGILCVGAAVFQDTFPVVVVAWEEAPDFGLLGFVPGHSMLFKMYTQNPLGEWFESEVGTIYETGNGNFGYGAYSALALVTSVVTITEQNPLPDHFTWQAFPNPFNHQVTFTFMYKPAGSAINLRICSLTGDEVFRTVLPPATQSYLWGGTDSSGRTLPAGNYLVSIRSGKFEQRGVITLLK